VVLAEALASRILGGPFEVLDTRKVRNTPGGVIGRCSTYSRIRRTGFLCHQRRLRDQWRTAPESSTSPQGSAADELRRRNEVRPAGTSSHPPKRLFQRTTPDGFRGKFIKEADPEIIADLDRRGHSYGSLFIPTVIPSAGAAIAIDLHRSQIVVYPTPNSMDKLIEYNQQINWYPPEIAPAFGEWLENNVDWRCRGTVLGHAPADLDLRECGEMKAIGSVAQLSSTASVFPADLDLAQAAYRRRRTSLAPRAPDA